jgi:hypothetical protein
MSHINVFKAAVQNVLEELKFLHDGKDGNVCASF